MKNIKFLFFIIFLEGYVVLSAELLALRLIIPYAGSGTDTASIIIAAVLMPLAIGYYTGGIFKEHHKNDPKRTIRKKLLQNIFVATVFLVAGLSYACVELFFSGLSAIDIQNRLIIATLYALIFVVTPVFFLAQTVPLVSNLFKAEALSKITGKMLFFSTLGSFAGAVFSTLVLMAYLGVHYTAVITIGCLCFLYIVLSRHKITISTIIVIVLFLIAFALNNKITMSKFYIIENNQYNTIRILEKQNGAVRILSLNNNNSSVHIDENFLADPSDIDKIAAKYVNYINQNFITTIPEEGLPKSILILGAGGFTIGLNDSKNDYTYIDIDSSLKEISEEHFIKRKLQPNKKFEAVPARGYLHKALQESRKFDLIILDTYKGAVSLPESLVTREAYQGMKNILKDDGIFIANFILYPNFADKLSIHIDNTLRTVFPTIGRQVLHQHDPWNDNMGKKPNILYIYYNKTDGIEGIYTDDKNRSYSDKDSRTK